METMKKEMRAFECPCVRVGVRMLVGVSESSQAYYSGAPAFVHVLLFQLIK